MRQTRWRKRIGNHCVISQLIRFTFGPILFFFIKHHLHRSSHEGTFFVKGNLFIFYLFPRFSFPPPLLPFGAFVTLPPGCDIVLSFRRILQGPLLPTALLPPMPQCHNATMPQCHNATMPQCHQCHKQSWTLAGSGCGIWYCAICRILNFEPHNHIPHFLNILSQFTVSKCVGI